MEYQWLYLEDKHDLIGPVVQATVIKIEDTSRPWVESGRKLTEHWSDDRDQDKDVINTTRDTCRLEVILDMLLVSSMKLCNEISWLNETLKRSILLAESSEHIYSTACLKHILNQIEDRTSICSPPENPMTKLIPGIYKDDFHGSTPSEIHYLAKYGLAQLLEERCFPRETPPARESPLITACRRKLPNMDVLRILVEKFYDDFNAQSQAIAEGETYLDQEEIDGGDTALYILALGAYWWSAALGIPYLGSQAGIDVNLRDDLGNTPLHIALRMHSCFQVETVEALIAIGADIIAVDMHGKDCLTLATSNPNLVKLLLDHGVEVTRSALIEYVGCLSIKSLNLLLSTGMDSNSRKASVRTTDKNPTQAPVKFKREWYPLHHALFKPQGGRDNTTMQKTVNAQSEIVTSLLKCGADPYDIFHQPLKLLKEQADALWVKTSHFVGLTETEQIEKYSVRWPFRLRVVGHQCSSPRWLFRETYPRTSNS